MNTHIHRAADRALRTVPNGNNLGGRDPTPLSRFSARTQRPVDLQPIPAAKSQSQRKKPGRFDLDSVAIWLFLIIVAIISVLVAFQLWAKLHSH